jgi:hypothetical protein
VIPTQAVCLYPEDETHDEDVHDNEENTPYMEDVLSNGLRNNLSNILDDNPSMSELTTQAQIASMRMMMEEQ